MRAAHVDSHSYSPQTQGPPQDYLENIYTPTHSEGGIHIRAWLKLVYTAIVLQSKAGVHHYPYAGT